MRVDGLHHQTSQEQEEASNLVQKKSEEVTFVFAFSLMYDIWVLKMVWYDIWVPSNLLSKHYIDAVFCDNTVIIRCYNELSSCKVSKFLQVVISNFVFFLKFVCSRDVQLERKSQIIYRDSFSYLWPGSPKEAFLHTHYSD